MVLYSDISLMVIIILIAYRKAYIRERELY